MFFGQLLFVLLLLLGRIPKAGETIRGIGHELRVVDSGTRRVWRLKLTLVPDEARESAAEPATGQSSNDDKSPAAPHQEVKPTGEGAG